MARSPADPAVSVDRFFELSLVGLVTSGYLAVLGSASLDAPTAIAVALGLALRALLVAGVLRFRLSARAIDALTVACIGFYPVDYVWLSREFLPATVHLVLFLAALKILTARTTRDYVLVAVIAFLELLFASVLSTNLSFFLFLALFLVFGLAALASSEIRRSMRKPRHLARGGLKNFHWRLAALTLSVALGILALTGGLFFLLPRTAQVAFRHLAPQRYRVPGFSSEMMLGEIGQIRQWRTAVMHVRFFDGERPAHLKWRGVALSQFDGRRWYNPAEAGQPLPVTGGLLKLRDRSRAAGIRYEVQLGSMTSDALFFAGSPVLLRINSPLVIRTSTDSYRLAGGNPEGLHYGVYSALEESPPVREVGRLSEEERLLHLLLPPVDRRLIALARQVTAGLESDEQRARAIESFLRSHYSYSTEPLSRQAADPLAHFLFQRRKGHCEYFASAMAVMLRLVNVPARVANGFQSGVYNPVSGWLVIRASDAHSWVEAWLPGRGWTTFDPTPPDPNPPADSLWSRLGFYLDAADTFWQEWVLHYNLDRQLILAAQMEDSSRTLGSRWLDRARAAAAQWKAAVTAWAGRYGVAALIAALLAGAAWWSFPRLWTWWKTLARVRQVQRGAARTSDATLLYARMLALLRRRGFERPAWITPAEFARLLPASETATLVARFTTAYNDLRFGGDRDAALRMMQSLEALERL
jgi:transglutaminase-like putative cysteine protease